MLLTIGAVIVVLAVLIFVHELGHFIAAKAVGVQVLRFSLGFGKPLVSVRRGETEYWISMLPLGGYVKMAGMEEQEGIAGDLEGGRPTDTVDPARAFDRKPVWARLVVLLAGVTMNVLLAFVIYATMAATIGTPEVATTRIDSVAAAQLPAGAEPLAQLHSGDQILRINGDTVRSLNAIEKAVLHHGGELRFDVAGRAVPLVVNVDSSATTRLALLRALTWLEPPRVGVVVPGMPASRAGLRVGDMIVRVNGDTARSWSVVLHVLWRNPDTPVNLDVLRGDAVVHLVVTPARQEDKDSIPPHPKIYGQIGAERDLPVMHVRQTLAGAARAGAEDVAVRVRIIVGMVKGLLLGQLSVREVGGPILIAQVSGQMARLGFERFLDFLAFFSVNLAVLNLLPIPLLDGGQVAFVLAEGVRRRPLPLNVRLRLQQIGFVLLVCLMIFAIGNDVVRSFFH
ncbi:MAG TPA: RIP metalloprotease RseP [Gemmatimonadales bacterium]